MNARLLTAFRWLARLAGHADDDLAHAGTPYMFKSNPVPGDVQLWMRRTGAIDVEITGLTQQQADHVLRCLRACALCDEATPANDRIPYDGRPAHAACAMRAQLRDRAARVAQGDNWDWTRSQAPPPPQPLVLHHEGCICPFPPPCDFDPLLPLDARPDCPVHKAEIEALRTALGARRRGPAS